MSQITRRSALATLAAAGISLPVLLQAQGKPAHTNQEQPHMSAALEALKNAKKHLDEAEADKEGHRKKAIELVENAIKEVEQGIKAGEKHEKDEKKKP
jgi:hypothetical protein